MNPRLRAAVNAAKAASMPKDNIARDRQGLARRRGELRGNPL
jgi:transcriptional/translational regulatory protein YebC/TACO1